MRSRKLCAAVAAGMTFFGLTAGASAQVLQDYEADALAAPWDLYAGYSGSSTGLDATNTTIALDTSAGAAGTAQSALHTIVDDPAASGAGTDAWSVRLLPNAAGKGDTVVASTGYFALYLKVPAGTTGLHVSPLLESESGGTFDSAGGILKDVIADGAFHLYEWNMDDASQWTETFNSLYSGSPTSAVTLADNVRFDSIAIKADAGIGATTELNIDQIQFSPTSLVPEPSSLALLGLGGLGLLRRRARR